MSRYLRALALLLFSIGVPSQGHSQSRGFQLNHYEPTPAGEWSFWVDHPWYSSTRYFAGGFTLNYARAPFILAETNPDGSVKRVDPILAHQLLGHFDLAGSFLDRVNLSFSLPLTLYEAGTARFGVSPVQGAAVGDPRFGVMVRLFGQPDRSPFSLHLGGYVFVPLRHFSQDLPAQSSDSEIRALPKLVLSGLPWRIRWSVTFGADIRSFEQLGTASNPDGSTTGTALQFGALVHYADLKRRLAIGPEVVFRTIVNRGLAGNPDYSSLEMFITGHYNIAGQVQIGLAGGLGLLREPGTPDGRFLFRIAYAPIRKKPEPVARPAIRDRDQDGVSDEEDVCPDAMAGPHPDPQRRGCPAPDRDHDGIYDPEDLCPDVAPGAYPDPQRRGCPAPDRDGDGAYDPEDRCPDVPAGGQPDSRPDRKGCPAPDRDGDGVIDMEDACPDKHMSAHPSKLPGQKGCPATDRDFDGVYEPDDLCPDVPPGLNPDPAKPGCPLPDRDGDSVPDTTDACPDKPGAPSTDAKKNGCPGLVEIKGGLLEIRQQVFFKTNSDEINAGKSRGVLDAVASALTALPQIKKVEVAGMADDKGSAKHNLELTERRAQSVRRWLIGHGIAEERLGAKGYGQVKLVAGESKKAQRARNRRVEFRLLDPPQPAAARAPAPQ